jgi:ABC-2 type transport system ATP-binding protein
MTVPAIDLGGLVKDFDVGLRGYRLRAVDHLTLQVAPGQIYGLLGPNGSGKTTTIKLALGLLQPTSGSCRIFGAPSGSLEARREIGYLPESPYFYRHLTGLELVRFYGRMCGLDGARLRSRASEVIALVGLEAAADRRVGTYSKGMLQRVGLAQALVHEPRLIILDEPTAGIDPEGASEIASLVRRLKHEGRTVLITSHLLVQMEELCDRVAILNRGRLVFEDALDTAGSAAFGSVRVDGLGGEDLAELRAWVTAKGGAVGSPRKSRLEEIYLRQAGNRAAGI